MVKAVLAGVLFAIAQGAFADQGSQAQPLGVVDSERMVADAHNTLLVSDDGRCLAIEGVLNQIPFVTVYDVPSGKSVFKADHARAATLSPDGKYFAYVESNVGVTPETLHLRSLEKGADVYSYQQRPSILYLQFDGTSKHLFHSMPRRTGASEPYGRLRAVAVKDGTTSWEIDVPTQYGGMQLWPSTGDAFAMETDRSVVCIYESMTGQQKVALQTPARTNIQLLSWSADAKHVLVTNDKREWAIFDTSTGMGGPWHRVMLVSPLCSPDLKYFILAQSGELNAFAVDDPSIRRSFRVGPRPKSTVRFNPFSGIACSVEDGDEGRVIVSRLPATSEWATVKSPTPIRLPAVQTTARKQIALPTTRPADSAWWLALAEDDFKEIQDPTARAQAGWALCALESKFGRVDRAKELLDNANRTGVESSVRTQGSSAAKLQAIFELTRRLAREDMAQAKAIFNTMSDEERFFADDMLIRALVLGRVDAGHYDEGHEMIAAQYRTERDVLASACVGALSAQKRYETATTFLDQMTPNLQRAIATAALATAALKDGKLDFANQQWHALNNLPLNPAMDVREPLIGMLATASEAAHRNDILDHLGTGDDKFLSRVVIQCRGIAMVRRGDWRGLNALLKPLADPDRNLIAHALAPEIAASGTDEQVIQFFTNAQGNVDWNEVTSGLLAASKVDQAIQHLKDPRLTPNQRQEMRSRIGNVLRQIGQEEKADVIDPQPPRRMTSPRDMAAAAWKKHDMAAYHQALDDFDKTYGRLLADQAARRAVMRSSLMAHAGDVEGAWATLQTAKAPVNSEEWMAQLKAEVQLYLAARQQQANTVARDVATGIEKFPPAPMVHPFQELVTAFYKGGNPDQELASLYGFLTTPSGRVRLAVASANAAPIGRAAKPHLSQ